AAQDGVPPIRCLASGKSPSILASSSWPPEERCFRITAELADQRLDRLALFVVVCGFGDAQHEQSREEQMTLVVGEVHSRLSNAATRVLEFRHCLGGTCHKDQRLARRAFRVSRGGGPAPSSRRVG